MPTVPVGVAMNLRGAAPFLLVSLAVIALDQFTKHLIVTHVGPYEVIEVTSFFNIVHVRNTGSAFSMLKGLSPVFFILIASLAILFIAGLIVRDKDNRLIYSLLLGGAAGNLIDRVRYGSVVDFLDFFLGSFHWPAFNVADSALTVGVAALLVTTLLGKGRRQ